MYRFNKYHMNKTPEDRFWDKVNKNGPKHSGLGTRCWLWKAAMNTAGYGCIGYEGKTVQAHRLSWELHNGPIPEGLYVLHHCDNPRCVNPAHLYIGTQADNVADSYKCGRRQRQRVGWKYLTGTTYANTRYDLYQVTETEFILCKRTVP